MPIHLLGKKSWNPYLPANLEHVRAVLKAVKEAEVELDELKDAHDAAVRAAKLCGEDPPSPPAERIKELERIIDPNVSKKRPGAEKDKEERSSVDWKKRRKLNGEDDTDRDIRVARLEREGAQEEKKRKERKAPILDERGHIQLFAPEEEKGVQKNEEAEKEKRTKERELEDQYTMRFSNASGYRQENGDPWYIDRERRRESETVGKNAFGRDDPRRHERDKARMLSKDPMAAMQAAQHKLKEAESAKKWQQKEDEKEGRRWREVERDHKSTSKHQHKHRHHHHPRHRSRSGDRDRHPRHRRPRDDSPERHRAKERHQR